VGSALAEDLDPLGAEIATANIGSQIRLESRLWSKNQGTVAATASLRMIYKNRNVKQSSAAK
jgi:nicotinate-nucleotide pyrophosphorylase